MTRVVPLFFASRCYISLSMSIQCAYRRLTDYFVVPLALLVSASVALALAALGVFILDFLFKMFNNPLEGPGAGVGILLAAVNIAIPTFVASFSLLVSWHHVTSWRAPTFAFALAAILLWIWAQFRFADIFFAPFVLGTGAITWVLSCWFVRRRSSAHSEHVIET